MGVSACIVWNPPCTSATNDSSSEARSVSRAGAAEGVYAQEERVADGALWTVGHGRNSVQQPQAACSSVAMAVPKSSGFLMIANYMVVMNQLFEQAAMPLPRLEALGMLLGTAAAFCAMDIFQGYWTCFVPVDYILMRVEDGEELVCRFDTILARLVKPGNFAAARRAVFFRDEIKWCRRLCSGKTTLPDRTVFKGRSVRASSTGERADALYSKVKHPALPDMAKARSACMVDVGGVSVRNEAAASGGGSAAVAYRRLDRRPRKGMEKYSETLAPSGTDLSS